MRLLRVLTVSLMLLAIVPGLVDAQDQSGQRPTYKMLRYDEDWSGLPGSNAASDWFDSLKYIPIGSIDGLYLTIGGEIRERYEYVGNGAWGREPHHNNYLLQRYMLHADVHLGSRLRFFGQLKSGLEVHRTGGPRPPDHDSLDVHQAFVDVGIWQAGKDSLELRLGRQEISFGSSRLLSFREGPNVRQSFDGARLLLQAAEWHIDVFATKPAETSRGVFDDSPDHTRSFWGLYAVKPFPLLPKGSIDLYYMGVDRKRARFDAGSGREQRHTAGARIWGETKAWDYNYEAAFQWGRFASGDIHAWTAASDTGYSIDSIKLHPRLGLKADVASGDRGFTDRTLGTFNALFPKGAYFSEADLLGPYNLMDLHPSIKLQLTNELTLTPDADFFWRRSTQDGIYGIPGNLIQSGRTATARYIGCHVSAQLEWQIDRHMSVTGVYLHFFPGAFLHQARPDRNVNFVGTWITYRF